MKKCINLKCAAHFFFLFSMVITRGKGVRESRKREKEINGDRRRLGWCLIWS